MYAVLHDYANGMRKQLQNLYRPRTLFKNAVKDFRSTQEAVFNFPSKLDFTKKTTLRPLTIHVQPPIIKPLHTPTRLNLNVAFPALKHFRPTKIYEYYEHKSRKLTKVNKLKNLSIHRAIDCQQNRRVFGNARKRSLTF